MDKQAHTALLTKAAEAFERFGLINSELPLVLMVSGGSDSVALLRLTTELCSAHLDRLHVFHLNHCLRGREADGDEAFVRELCQHLGIAYTVERVDVAALAKESNESTEQVGRRVRYTLAEALLDTSAPAISALVETVTDSPSASVSGTLADVALEELSTPAASARRDLASNAVMSHSSCSREPENKSGHILTAHTADDRAETLLQRLIVGGGSGSLASIPWQNKRVIRPLLDCTRQELQEWLRAKDAPVNGCLWREDATNLDTTYSRAYVRHKIMPLLEERNPRIIQGLNRTAEVLSEESAWLDEQAAQLLPLTSESFQAPLPLVRRAVYLACNEAQSAMAPDARITFEHVNLIAEEGGRKGFACQIPGGIEVRNVRGNLVFSKAKPPKHDPRQ